MSSSKTASFLPNEAAAISSPASLPMRSSRWAGKSPKWRSLPHGILLSNHENKVMSRKICVAAAQLGPINMADSRTVVVKRLVAMLREAASMGAKFVVFPELAFTTFFPRYWYEDEAEAERKFFEKSMPSPETQPLFDEAKKHGIGFYVGYAELTEDNGKPHRYNTAILVSP